MKILVLPILLTAFTLTAFGESGSGNGDIDREVQIYEAKLERTKSDLRTLEDTFESMKIEMMKVSAARVPAIGSAPDAFWDQLTNNDRRLLQSVDKTLIDYVSMQMAKIPEIRKKLTREQAKINALAREISHYEERGMGGNFKSDLKKSQTYLDKEVRVQLVMTFTYLKWRVETIGEKFEGRYENGDNGAYKFWKEFRQCESALCGDLIEKALFEYMDHITALSKIPFAILGERTSFSQLCSNDVGRCGNTERDFSQAKRDIRKTHYETLKYINEDIIDRQNVPQ